MAAERPDQTAPTHRMSVHLGTGPLHLERHAAQIRLRDRRSAVGARLTVTEQLAAQNMKRQKTNRSKRALRQAVNITYSGGKTAPTSEAVGGSSCVK
ncbi:hypothetical protein GDO78_021138 [Eleutherodactylus coqui]|uniref:Uncharacterized protein n=1 Tax=Eleutherodactylus coqui TaxID=57060 RepID=A0A8J6EHM9_ELECQ|nr:hypothetical protein GDO78_021138 [Eleutherodactylus coqui]